MINLACHYRRRSSVCTHDRSQFFRGRRRPPRPLTQTPSDSVRYTFSDHVSLMTRVLHPRLLWCMHAREFFRGSEVASMDCMTFHVTETGADKSNSYTLAMTFWAMHAHGCPHAICTDRRNKDNIPSGPYTGHAYRGHNWAGHILFGNITQDYTRHFQRRAAGW
jgi:hypothetical protein